MLLWHTATVDIAAATASTVNQNCGILLLWKWSCCLFSILFFLVSTMSTYILQCLIFPSTQFILGCNFTIWADDQVMYGEIGMFFFGWRCPNECKTSVYFTFVGKICGHMAHIIWALWEEIGFIQSSTSAHVKNKFANFSFGPNVEFIYFWFSVSLVFAHAEFVHGQCHFAGYPGMKKRHTAYRSRCFCMSMCLNFQNCDHMAKHFSAKGGPPDLTNHRLYT